MGTKRSRMKSIWAKIILWTVVIAVALVAAASIAFQVSPWPSVLLIRYAFQKDAVSVSRALEKHVPEGISAQLNEHYAAADGDAYLDVFYPSKVANSERSLTTIVWVHGGGWVSGTKDQIANYAKILAGKGYTVVGVDYSLAPGATFPTPARQVNTALAYLANNAKRLHVDPSRFVLAGDSGGAHIAAVVANAIAVPSYAKAVGIAPSIERSQIAGMLLYCGPYTAEGINLDGPFGNFMKTVLWAFSGEREFKANSHFATAWVMNYVTAVFPPTFISAGNADPLLPQSVAFAGALSRYGVRVDSLFFPDDYKPPLPHEYQFNLDTEPGKLALERSIAFLSSLHSN